MPILLIIFSSMAFSQKIKPPLDFQAVAKWKSVGSRSAISNDGMFLAYLIQNQPENWNTLTVKSTRGDWIMQIPVQQEVDFYFSVNSKELRFQKSPDTLAVITLGKNTIKYLSQVSVKSTLKPFDAKAIIQLLPDSLEFIGFEGFSKDSSAVYLSVSLKQSPLPALNTNASKVTIWNYKDEKIQSEQTTERPQTRYTVLLSPAKGILKLIGKQEAGFYRISNTDYWLQEIKASDSCSLIDPLLGKCIIMPSLKKLGKVNLMLPEQRQIIYFDSIVKQYISYHIDTKNTDTLTQGIAEDWLRTPDERSSFGQPRKPPVWSTKEQAFFVFARYDIWLIDPLRIRKPLLLTKGIGSKYKIQCNIWPNAEHPVFNKKGEILISAYNDRSKEHGDFFVNIARPRNTVSLNMQKMLFCASPSVELPNGLDVGVKAKNADVYLCKASQNSSSMNYFTTSDFKHFTQQSFVRPESQYNWLSRELLTYQVGKTDTASAILYKPEDFDPLKKYPLIIYCYESLSQLMYAGDELYINKVKFSEGALNIPWFVSHGYLVLAPDIKQPTAGEVGKNALMYVNAATDFLTKRSYVDSNKIGIQGHSFGGRIVNYLVTHSHRFVAACAAAAASDMISMYGVGNILLTGSDKKQMIETGQPNMRSTPWSNKASYIENTPFLDADKITTPLLLLHNKLDKSVPYFQGVEMYTALRRLYKPVWLIEYEGEGHILDKELNQKDFTIRMQQFFDHYLKDALAPIWMTQGIPRYLAGRVDGLALDGAGK